MHIAPIRGAATPFSKEYDQPWLYGVAALPHLALVAKNKHWASDTVAGSLFGYGLGSLAWRWNRRQAGAVGRRGRRGAGAEPGRHSGLIFLADGFIDGVGKPSCVGRRAPARLDDGGGGVSSWRGGVADAAIQGAVDRPPLRASPRIR